MPARAGRCSLIYPEAGNPVQVLNSSNTLLTFQVWVWERLQWHRGQLLCAESLWLCLHTPGLLLAVWILMLFQSNESIRISHARSARIVDIHRIAKISQQPSLHLAYVGPHIVHTTEVVLVAREYIQEMHGVNRTVGDGFLGPQWICQSLGSAAGIWSSGMVLVKQNCSSNVVLPRTVFNTLWEFEI